jgi:PAT family beta-lactamase induction signal transducer AmpG
MSAQLAKEKQGGNPEGRQRSLVRSIFSTKMLVSLLMGFSCGLPLLLTLSVLQAWMTEEGVDLTVIGLMALVGLPYTLKFVWAPIFDRFTLPLLGRRRGWLLLMQLTLAAAICALGMTDPVAAPWMVAQLAQAKHSTAARKTCGDTSTSE